MKKRLISLLLTVCMLTVLFAGLTVNVSADTPDKITGYLVSYTFKAGDTIYAVCEAKGIDFSTNLNQIAKINNITNFNYMMPGKVLWLPSKTATTDQAYYSLLTHVIKAGETPASLCQSYGVNYNTNYNLLAALNSNMNVFMVGQTFVLPLYIDPSGSTPTPTPTAAAPTPTPQPGTTPAPTAVPSAIPAGDSVAYYLAQHVLQYGETVSGICAAMGIDFASNSDAILRINNIANYNYMLPGKALYFPVKTVPTSGSYYKVMAHKVAAGDTVYDLCFKYGINFGTYENMIKGLNKRDNLASFYPGQTLYMPMYVAASSSFTPVTGVVTAVTGRSITVNGVEYVTVGGTLEGADQITVGMTVTISLAADGTKKFTVGTPTAAPSGAPTAAPSGAPTAAPSAKPVVIPEDDTLSYLIIPHTLKAGETVSGVCAELGVDFANTSDQIMRLSNISSYNYLMPGKVIYIPSTVYPASGPYYKVMAHVLKAGDTVYDLCSTYGLDYTSNAAFLQRINNRDNLATYYVGQTVYMPLYVAG